MILLLFEVDITLFNESQTIPECLKSQTLVKIEIKKKERDKIIELQIYLYTE